MGVERQAVGKKVKLAVELKVAQRVCRLTARRQVVKK
jgi:hypothetical protein